MLRPAASIILLTAALTGCHWFERDVKFRLCSDYGRIFDITIYNNGRALYGDVLQPIERCSPDTDCMASPFPFARPPGWPEVQAGSWRQGNHSFRIRRLSDNQFELTSTDERTFYIFAYHADRGVRELVTRDRTGRYEGETSLLRVCAGRLTFDNLPGLLSDADAQLARERSNAN